MQHPRKFKFSSEGSDCTHKGTATPIQAWTDLEGSKRLRHPGFLDSRHMKVVMLSALHTGRLYSPGDIPATHFC
jgi:hypothetical protein